MNYFGFFCELPFLEGDAPSIRDFARAEVMPYDSQDQIVSYLASGWVLADMNEVALDLIVDDGTPACGRRLLTDGDWIWPQEIAYYVDVYGVLLPAAFVGHMRLNGWRVPQLSSSDLARIASEIPEAAADGR